MVARLLPSACPLAWSMQPVSMLSVASVSAELVIASGFALELLEWRACGFGVGPVAKCTLHGARYAPASAFVMVSSASLPTIFAHVLVSRPWSGQLCIPKLVFS